MRKHFGYVFIGIVLSVMPVTGCAAQNVTNNSMTLQNNTINAVLTNSTSKLNTSASNATQPPVHSTTAQGTVTTTDVPMEIDAMPGELLSAQWPVIGANPVNVGTGMFKVDYTSSGPTIGGVHWTWPLTDDNPKDYMVVPTTIQRKPYLVWVHIAPQKNIGQSENGSVEYSPHQLEPTGPSQMWMTPWNTKGGSLSNNATLLTDDIPPVFSTSGQYLFPANSNDSTPQSLASSAWSGWFQWGHVAHPYTRPSPKSPIEPTVAFPNGLYPAYNGVVLAIGTQVLQANQGGAVNLYYLDLANRKIIGLASLTNGGGQFSSMRVVSGMVFSGAAAEWGHNGQIKATANVYDEVSGQRTSVESSAVMSQNNGFNDWVFRGSKVYDANNKLQADLNLSSSVTREPSAATFGLSIR